MKRSLAILLGFCLLSGTGLAQENSATVRILPEDVVQSSIKLVPNGRTNQISVWWTYTEAGARKLLGFWEAHEGQKAATQVGSFTTPVGLVQPPANRSAYAAWKQGWLERRTDKFFSVSLEDAKKIVNGVKK